MTSNEALKPCPFCGDPMLTHSVEGRLQGFTHTPEATEKAVCYLRHTYYAGEQVDWWNTRSTDTPVCVSTVDRRGEIRNVLYRNLPTEIDGNLCRKIADEILALAASQAPETIERLREAVGDALELLNSPVITPDALNRVGRTLESALSSIPEPLIMPLEGAASGAHDPATCHYCRKHASAQGPSHEQ